MVNVKKRYGEYLLEPDKTPLEKSNHVTVRHLGVTTLLFDDGETKLMIDGMVTRPSIPRFLFRKLDTNRRLVSDICEKCRMNPLEAIFVSHSHYDHVLDVPEFALQTGARIYGSRSTVNAALGYGVAADRTEVFEADHTYQIGKFSVRVLHSIHSRAKWYNDDLGVEITAPLKYPARKKAFTEGGSYDFYIEHGDLKILIRPSCNYIMDSLDGIHADLLFLGIGQYSKLSPEEKDRFYAETIGKVRPRAVLPIHWENFFVPINKWYLGMPEFLDHTADAMDEVIQRLEADKIRFGIVQVGKKQKI